MREDNDVCRDDDVARQILTCLGNDKRIQDEKQVIEAQTGSYHELLLFIPGVKDTLRILSSKLQRRDSQRRRVVSKWRIRASTTQSNHSKQQESVPATTNMEQEELAESSFLQ